MNDESKFQVGQLVKYRDQDYVHEECPHCGQDYERKLPAYEVTTTVKRVDTDWFADGKGGVYSKTMYLLVDRSYVSETALEAA